MKLWINGEPMEVPEDVSTVADLLNHFGIEEKIAVVEVNLNILSKSEHAASTLAEGDRIEIVHFVGGG